MGILKKERLQEVDEDTPAPIRRLLDRIPNNPMDQVHISLSLSIEELLSFAEALVEARKKYNERSVQ